jgi:integral membrane protein
MLRSPLHCPGEPTVTPRQLFRTLAIAEAVTWTLLIAGMIAKYALQWCGLGVSIGGFAHGLVFLAYGLTVLLVGVNQRWNLRLMALAVLSAVVPYATIPFEIWASRSGALAGSWRRDVTADRRDHTWYAGVLRWMLRHPAILVITLVVVLAIVMTVLLIAEPPV